MTAWVPYECPEDVCKAVRASKGFHERFGMLAARPWNPHEPRTTMWWLVPFGDGGKSPWPAFHVGKFQFAFSGDRKRIHVGLHVEKGLSVEAASVLAPDKAKAQKMTSEWRWHRFVIDLRWGVVTSTIREVTRRHGLPLQVRVYGGPPEKLYEDVSERAVFDVKNGRLVAVPPTTMTKLLPPLHGVTGGPELADAIEGSPLRNGWVWIDVRLMSSFELGPRANLDAADEWNGDRLWETFLSQFAQWVR